MKPPPPLELTAATGTLPDDALSPPGGAQTPAPPPGSPRGLPLRMAVAGGGRGQRAATPRLQRLASAAASLSAFAPATPTGPPASPRMTRFMNAAATLAGVAPATPGRDDAARPLTAPTPVLSRNALFSDKRDGRLRSLTGGGGSRPVTPVWAADAEARQASPDGPPEVPETLEFGNDARGAAFLDEESHRELASMGPELFDVGPGDGSPSSNTAMLSLLKATAGRSRIVSESDRMGGFSASLRRGLGNNKVAQLVRETEKFPCFRGLSRPAHAEVVRASRRMRLHGNEVVFLEGEEASLFYVILSGTADIWVKSMRPGHPILVDRRSSGDSFGDLALLRRTVRSGTVVTTESTELMVIERTDFDRLLRDHLTEQLGNKLDTLSKVSPFNNWAEQALSRLSYGLQVRYLTKGQPIFEKGERASHVFFVRSGRGRIVHDVECVNTGHQPHFGRAKARQRLDLLVVSDRELLGEVDAVMGRRHREFTAIADTPMELYTISWAELLFRTDFATRKHIEYVSKQKEQLLRQRVDAVEDVMCTLMMEQRVNYVVMYDTAGNVLPRKKLTDKNRLEAVLQTKTPLDFIVPTNLRPVPKNPNEALLNAAGIPGSMAMHPDAKKPSSPAPSPRRRRTKAMSPSRLQQLAQPKKGRYHCDCETCNALRPVFRYGSRARLIASLDE